jgi:hypothetical protein
MKNSLNFVNTCLRVVDTRRGGSEGTSSGATQDLGQQASPSSAVQAYNNLGQNPLQAELGSDITGAQIAGEISSLSLTV